MLGCSFSYSLHSQTPDLVAGVVDFQALVLFTEGFLCCYLLLLLGLSFVLILLVLPSIVSDSSLSTTHRQQFLYEELADINSRFIGTTLLCFGLPVCELRYNNKPFGNSSGSCNSSSAKLQFLTLPFCFWVSLIRSFLRCSIWEFYCCDQANLSLFAYLVGVKSSDRRGSNCLCLCLSISF